MKIYSKVFILFFLLSFTQLAIAEDSPKVDTLIIGDWGTKDGEFGIDKSGRTELGYALDFVVTKNNIFILDSINNRIQVFDASGVFQKNVKLNIRWEDFGLAWDFTMHKDTIYLLVGKSPYYTSADIKQIYKFSPDGNFLKKFGSEYVTTPEEYYSTILSDMHKGHIYCGLGGAKVLTFNPEGDLKDTVVIARKGEDINLVGMGPDGNLIINVSQSGGKNRRTVLINPDSKKIKMEIKGRFTLADERGRFFDIHTLAGSKRKKKAMVTMLEVFDSIEKKSETFELKGDVTISKNGKDRIYRYSGNFLERSKIGPDGKLYHLIALNDGVVLRKISMHTSK